MLGQISSQSAAPPSAGLRRGLAPAGGGGLRSPGLPPAGMLLCLLLFLLSWGSVSAQPAEPASPPRSVTVGLYISPPFVSEEQGSYDGMAVDLWEIVAGHLDLATRYVIYPTFRDLVEATRRGEVDAAVTNLTITRQRAEVLSFTQPWYDAGLRIMVPGKSSGGFWSVVTGLSQAGHLQAYLWLAFVIALATVSLTVFDRRFDPDFPRRWREGVAESFYHIISLTTSGRTARKNLFGWKGRIWSAIWMVCGVAVIAYITSSVTSVMTAVSLDRGINSLADLSGRTAGVFIGSVAESYVTELGIAARSYPDIEAAVEALEKGFVDAIVADAPILEHYAHHHPQRGLAVVGALFHPDKYGFAFPLHSDLVRPVTLELIGAQEQGLIGDIRLKYFGSSQ